MSSKIETRVRMRFGWGWGLTSTTTPFPVRCINAWDYALRQYASRIADQVAAGKRPDPVLVDTYRAIQRRRAWHEAKTHAPDYLDRCLASSGETE